MRISHPCAAQVDGLKRDAKALEEAAAAARSACDRATDEAAFARLSLQEKEDDVLRLRRDIATATSNVRRAEEATASATRDRDAFEEELRRAEARASAAEATAASAADDAEKKPVMAADVLTETHPRSTSDLFKVEDVGDLSEVQNVTGFFGIVGADDVLPDLVGASSLDGVKNHEETRLVEAENDFDPLARTP